MAILLCHIVDNKEKTKGAYVYSGVFSINVSEDEEVRCFHGQIYMGHEKHCQESLIRVSTIQALYRIVYFFIFLMSVEGLRRWTEGRYFYAFSARIPAVCFSGIILSKGLDITKVAYSLISKSLEKGLHLAGIT